MTSAAVHTSAVAGGVGAVSVVGAADGEAVGVGAESTLAAPVASAGAGSAGRGSGGAHADAPSKSAQSAGVPA